MMVRVRRSLTDEPAPHWREDLMARDPEDVDEARAEELADDTVYDEEAVIDEENPDRPLVDAEGLGVDLPEADVLDQRREVDLDEDEGREQ
jgi:hypothetical protein